jgi:alpha-2-macroglobulin
MVQESPVRKQVGWLEALIVFCCLLWLGYGLARSVQSEVPKGRLGVQVTAQETGVPLPKVRVRFELEGKDPQTWTFHTDASGTFRLASMPAGNYRVYAYTRAHQLQDTKFLLKEGEQKDLILRLAPSKPFLEVIHPQPVYLPGEKVKIGLRGFIKENKMQVGIERLNLTASSGVPVGELFETLDDLRTGWWRGQDALEKRFQKLQPFFEKVQQQEVSVTGRDIEGVSLQYLPLEVREPGTYLVRFRAGALEEATVVIRTEAGLILKTSGNRELLAWLSHLKQGKALANLTVEAWADRRLAGVTTSSLLSRVSTSPQGLARLKIPSDLEGIDKVYVLAKPQGKEQPLAWLSQYLPDRPTSAQPILGHLYTDRPVYRPGNKVYFKGVLRQQTKRSYALLRNPGPITVLVRDPDDNLLSRQALKLSRFDSLASSVQLTEEAKVGRYRVTAQVNGATVEGSFDVAAYKKPTFQITLRPEKKYFTVRDLVRLDLNARYFFGMPVGEASVRYRVYRLPLYEWEEADAEAEDEDASAQSGSYGSYGETVLEGTTRTDDQGRAAITFKPSELPQQKTDSAYGDHPSNYRYAVSVSIQAAGNEYAEVESSFPVTQGNWRLTATPTPYFTQPGVPVQVKVNLQDRQTGKPPTGTIPALQWRTGTQEWSGRTMRIDWKGPSGSVAVNDQGAATWTFKPDREGDWVFEVTTQDAQGNSMTSQSSVWVSSYGEVAPAAPQAPLLQVITDKRTYQLGERAKVALRSPLPDAQVLLSLEGDTLHQARLVSLVKGHATVEVPIKECYIPSAYLSVALVHDKRLIQETIPLRIGTQAKKLQVTLQTDKPRYEPREKAEITVQTRSADGQPVSTELSLAVVDEALFAIREDSPGSLFNTFYARRPNQVQTTYSFPWIALQGDKGSGAEVRRDFPDTALWLPQLMTDAKGFAKVSLPLPDNLTQWRITALGQTADLQLGYGVQRFVSRKEFAVRLAMPSVLTEGDEVTVSAVVSNDGAQQREAQVTLITGEDSEKPTSITIAPGKSETVQWTYRAKRLGSFPFQVRAISQDGRRDAEERRVTIQPFATQNVVAHDLMLPAGRTDYAFTPPPGLVREASRLTVHLAPSIFSQLLGTLDYLVDYPYGCTEQTLSRFLPGLAMQEILQEKGIALPDLTRRTPEVVQKGLARLYRFQHDDGGWGWWEDDENDLWMTAYVVYGLTKAQQSGLVVNAEAYQRGRESLARQVREQELQGFAKSPDRYIRDTYAFALYSLALSGSPMPNSLPKLRSLAKDLTPYGKAMLTLAFDRWQQPEAAQALVSQLLDLKQQSRAGIYWEPTLPTSLRKVKEDRWFGHHWLNANETTAWVLLAMMRTESLPPEELQAGVRWLLAQRQNQGWESTKDTAVVLDALLAYSRRYEKPVLEPTTVQVLLNGKSIGKATFNERSIWYPEATLKLPTAPLISGENKITFETAAGKASLYGNVSFQQSERLSEAEPKAVSTQGPLKLERTYALLRSSTGADGLPTFEEVPLKAGDKVTTGSLVRVRVNVLGWKKDTELSHLILEDPLPGGFRPTDSSLPGEDYNPYTTEIRDDRIIGYYRTVWEDNLNFDYLLRAEVPGTFRALPSRLWSMYGDWRLLGPQMKLQVVP